MAGFLLDTNHLSEAIRPVSRVRERIEQAPCAAFASARVCRSSASWRPRSTRAFGEQPIAEPSTIF